MDTDINKHILSYINKTSAFFNFAAVSKEANSVVTSMIHTCPPLYQNFPLLSQTWDELTTWDKLKKDEKLYICSNDFIENLWMDVSEIVPKLEIKEEDDSKEMISLMLSFNEKNLAQCINLLKKTNEAEFNKLQASIMDRIIKLAEYLPLGIYLKSEVMEKEIYNRRKDGYSITSLNDEYKMLSYLRFGLSALEINNLTQDRWGEKLPGLIFGLKLGFSYARSKETPSYKLKALALGLSEEQIAHTNFQAYHLDTLLPLLNESSFKQAAELYENIIGLNSWQCEGFCKYHLTIAQVIDARFTYGHLKSMQKGFPYETIINIDKDKLDNHEKYWEGRMDVLMILSNIPTTQVSTSRTLKQ